MADSQVSVELIAKIDGLTSGLSQASAAMQSAAEAMVSGLKDVGEESKETETLMQSVLSGAAFLEFKEIATEALESIKEAFEATVAKAEEFGLANAKVASMMHTSDADAAGLAAALRGVGSSTQAYESIALRLQKTLETGTGAAAYFGEALKGPNGESLTGTALMDRLREALSTYSDEGKNAAVVALGLGRKYSDLYDIMRVGSDDIEHQKEIYASFGVNLDDNKEASAQLEEKMTDLHTTIDAVEISLGQKLMPTVTAFIDGLDNAKPAIQAIQVALSALITVLATIKVAFKAAGDAIYTIFAEIFDVLKGVGTQIGDILSGNFKALAGDGAAAVAEMKADAADYWARQQADGQAYLDLMRKLWGEEDARAESKKEGGGFAGFSGPLPGSGGPKGKPHGVASGPDKEQEEDISAAQKLALDKIAIEESTNSHLLSMGQESVAAFVAQARELENQTFAVKQEALHKELGVTGQTQAAKEKILDQMQQLEQAHEGKLLQIDQDGESRRRQTSQEELANFIKDSNEKLTIATTAIDKQFQAEQIGAFARANQELALTQAVKQGELDRLTAEMSTLAAGTKAYEEVYKQREKVVKDYVAEVKKIQEQETKDVQASVAKWTAPMTSAFNSAFNDMLLHGKSFSDGMKQMGTSMLEGFINVLEQMAEKWLVTQVSNALVADETQGAMGLSRVTSEAAIAAAGAFASTASLPYPANLAAPGAAAAAEASVMAFAPQASAAGGMLLDRDQAIFAHKGEQVLPAHLSKGIQDMIAGRGPAGGSPVHFNYNPTVNAPESRTLAQLLDSESRTMLGWIAARSRDGSLRRNM